MFQFRRFPTHTYFIQRTLYEYGSYGFPHSDIPGSSDICSSPRLFAACHVLLRLLMPRHSPCALIRLTSSTWIPLTFSADPLFRSSSDFVRSFTSPFHSQTLPRPLKLLGSLLNYASTLFYRSFSKLLPTLTLFKLKSFSQFPLCCFAFPLFSFQSAIPREYSCTL